MIVFSGVCLCHYYPFLLFIIIIIMCTHICSLTNACSQSLVSAFSHSMSAHMCAVWSAHSCSAWPAHIHTAWSVHSLFCAYSRSLASAQLARQCIFAVWSAHSLVNAFSGSLISVCSYCNKCVQYKMAFFLKGNVLLFWVRWILTSYKHTNSKC